MPWQFDSHAHRIAVPSPTVTGLDFTNDGHLLAVSHLAEDPGDASPCVSVLRTEDGALVGTFGAGSGRGVVFAQGEDAILHIVQSPEGVVRLERAPLDGAAPRVLATYGGRENVQRIRRSGDHSMFAVLGSGAEVWRSDQAEVVRFREGDTPGRPVHACFDASGAHLYLLGLEDGVVVGISVATNQEFGRWQAPKSHGPHVEVSGDERYLVVAGKSGSGLYIHDLMQGSRYDGEEYNELSYAEPLIFTHDSSAMVAFALEMELRPMDGSAPVSGPELPRGNITAQVSAWRAPVVACAAASTVTWARLVAGEPS